ncbi:MAG: hypothetical protein V1904_03470 [Bacteroidota bacterium]
MGLFLILTINSGLSYANYNLNFADPNSFSITCGKLTSWWTVKNDSCILYTAFMRVEVDSSVLTCDFRLNQSGNLDLTDNAYIQYQVNDGGWVTDTCVSGYGLDAVWFRSFPLTLYYGDYIQFRVIYETNDQTEFWGLQNGDISISGDFVIYPTAPGPLPVEFIDVSSLASENYIIVNWSTASETNNDYFTIERSEDGINFYTIGITDGAGNSNNVLEYQYMDNEPLNGTNLYRIRQTDFDGQYSFSAIVSAYFKNIRDNIIVHSENGFLKIYLTSENESVATLSIFEMNGKQVVNENYIINKGQNSLSLNNEIFSKSIYLIHLMKSDGTSISRKYFLH